MKRELNIAERIEKEMVSNLHFPPQEVLSDKMKIEERMIALHRATSLGNLEKHKVAITFQDEAGFKEVFTTIWAITDNKVILKGGRVIPVQRIHSVKIS